MVVKYVLRRIFIVMNWLIKYCLGELLYLAQVNLNLRDLLKKEFYQLRHIKNSQPNLFFWKIMCLLQRHQKRGGNTEHATKLMLSLTSLVRIITDSCLYVELGLLSKISWKKIVWFFAHDTMKLRTHKARVSV